MPVFYGSAVDGSAWHTAGSDAWAKYAKVAHAAAVKRGEAAVQDEDDGTT